MIEYPKWKYAAGGLAVVVEDRAAELALGPGWVDNPAQLTAAPPPAPPLAPPVSAPPPPAPPPQAQPLTHEQILAGIALELGPQKPLPKPKRKK